jgi:FliI/YscN family ATPase
VIAVRGRVVACRAHRIEARLQGARLGDRVTIEAAQGAIPAFIAAVEAGRAILSPLGDARRVAPGDAAVLEEGAERTILGAPLLGRAIDGLGRPLDGGPPPLGARLPPPACSLAPADRRPLVRALWTGVRVVDALLTPARGMRIGIFGAPGTGKSTLLETLARGIDADAVVVALIGERGVEARRRLEMLDARTTIVCAPSDRTAGEGCAAGDLALAHAARLRDCGLDVAVIFDSLARYAHAAREIALGCGEPPGRGGFPPSVFTRLAALCERAGATASGSITLVVTVLSEAADPADPLAEAARSHLDGQLVLSRRRAERGAFPAIDVPASLSRPMPHVVTPPHLAAALKVREALARLEETRELRELGVPSIEPGLARAAAAEPSLEAFARQGEEVAAVQETLARLQALADIL